MDDLTRIKGIGAATAKKLNAAGIETFAALALANHLGEPLASIAKSDIEAVAWITAAAGLADVPPNPGETKSKEKPLGSGHEPEAQLQDGARLPADGRAGDRQPSQTNIPPEPPSQGNDQGGSGNAAAPAQAPAGVYADWASQIETDSELAEFCPHVAGALRAWAESNSRLPELLVITSKREGFRRGGIAHPRAETEHEFDAFDFDDIEQMLAEPVLSVRLA
jgi:hypothetical protein